MLAVAWLRTYGGVRCDVDVLCADD
eukprot:COSAG01_NODE_34848_length_541_cov_0.696833_1_plen_24_part_10